MIRPLIFAANWKMHHGPGATRDYLRHFLPLAPPLAHRSLWFFTPAASLMTAAEMLRDRADAHVGAQNIHWEGKGAFTGELSAAIACDAGAEGTLVGHSERRHLFGETDGDAARKVAAALASGLVPMLCVGETLEEREAGQTEAVCLRQLRGGLESLGPDQLLRVLVAYEPVWAIGTGRTATPADAAAVHRTLRTCLVELGQPYPVILYGGSVNQQNVQELVAQDEIDGVLVGGASLDPLKWAELVALGSPG